MLTPDKWYEVVVFKPASTYQMVIYNLYQTTAKSMVRLLKNSKKVNTTETKSSRLNIVKYLCYNLVL